MSKKKRRRTPQRRPRPPAPRPRSRTPPVDVTVLERGGPSGGGPGAAARDEVSDGQLELLIGLVATGVLDDRLGVLQAAISRRQQDRQQDASRAAAAQLRVGDRVMISEVIRPQYLRGATGTVTGWAGQSAVVQLDAPAGRYATREIRCPPLGLHRLAG